MRLNGIEPGGETALLDLEAEEAAKAMAEGRVEAVFLMGDSASPSLLRRLLQSSEVKIFDVSQADAYVRRLTYLNKLTFPKGVIDFGKNIPARDVFWSALPWSFAREKLHPRLWIWSSKLLRRSMELLAFSGAKTNFPPPWTRFSAQRRGGPLLQIGQKVPLRFSSLLARERGQPRPGRVRSRGGVVDPGSPMLPTLLRLRVKLQLYR